MDELPEYQVEEGTPPPAEGEGLPPDQVVLPADQEPEPEDAPDD